MGIVAATVAVVASCVTMGGTPGEFTVNLDAVAGDFVRGRANVTIVGDSINNYGQADWMYSGYLLEWRPHRWRQIHVNPVSSALIAGAWATYSPQAQFRIIQPGQTVEDFEDFVGAVPNTIRVIRSPGWSGRAVAAGFHKDAFDVEGGLLRDADGTGRLLRSGHRERHRVMLVAADAEQSRICWTIKSRNSAAGTSPARIETDVCFPVNSTPSLIWRDVETDGSLDGLGHVADELHTASDGPLGAGERTGFAGSILTDLDLDNGLGLTYIGQGGWRVGNHAHPAGSPEVPVINLNNPYPGSYSNDALMRHILAHETSHFLVWLGTNNGGVDFDHPERTVQEMAVLLDRFRSVHALARRKNPTLAAPKFLIVSPYCSSDDCAYFRAYGDLLRDLATGDTAFLDLRGLVERHFGPWSDWESEFLVDGTHPTLAGSRTFARLIWRELVQAAGLPTDLDCNGVVDGGDFGLFLQHYGSEDPFDAADFNGDGRVRGDDLGLLFIDWGRTAD